MEDAVDTAIVRLLAEDGRMSYADLARETGLSTSAVHQRVKRLEARGIIAGYRAVVDGRAVGLSLTAFVSLTPLDPAAPDDVSERIATIEEIEGCWSVAGAESYIVKVRVSDPQALEELLGRIRLVANSATRTTVVLSTAFEGRAPAL